MTRRVNETVYRVRWMRRSWSQPRSEVFLSRYKAERRLEKLRESWQGSTGPNPLAWTSVESSSVTWEGGDMDKRPYAWHPPVPRRKGSVKNLRSSREALAAASVTCRRCDSLITQPAGFTIWSSGGDRGHICPAGGAHIV